MKINLFDELESGCSYTIKYEGEEFAQIDVEEATTAYLAISKACYNILKETNEMQEEDVIGPTVLSEFFNLIHGSMDEESIKEVLKSFEVEKL